MDPDVLLILGLTLACFSVPSMLAAHAERQPPRLGMVMLMLGGGLVLLALTTRPGGYSLQEVPQALLRVLAMVLP